MPGRRFVVTDDDKILVDAQTAKEIEKGLSDKSDKPNYTIINDGKEKEE